MAVGQHQAGNCAADRAATARVHFLPNNLMRLLDHIPQGRQPICWRKPRRDCGDHIGNQPAGVITRLMPAHTIGHQPQAFFGQSQHRIFVHFALQANMAARAVPDTVT